MLNKLVQHLHACDDAYYNGSSPIVSDSTYDALVETLRRINPDHPYLSKVGAKVKSDASKVGHIFPMGTLSKLHKDDEVLKWLNTECCEIVIAPKYDGFAVELVYDKGNLIAASTRGDGDVGEDVLEAVKCIKNIPISLTHYPTDVDQIIVRGEAIIPKKHHAEIKKLGYSAMRNAVPGIVRSNRKEALGYVDYVAYEFIDGNTDRVKQRVIYDSDFKVEDYRTRDYKDMDSLKRIREVFRNEDYEYEIDGVVLKTRVIVDGDILLTPDHMVAWKYKSNREATTLRAIDYQMGLTGYFTPIAIFDEVEFQGAKLTRASLGNMTRLADEFEGATIGSIVEVSRRGDIIPYCEELVVINEEGEKIEKLVKCPHCGELLSYDEKEPHCTNKSCPEKLRLQISQYARAVGIKGIGDKLIRGLIDAGEVSSIIDIYTINSEVIFNIPRQGASSVEKWDSLKDKRLSAVELLTAYPFIDLGRKVWENVLTKFNYEDILNITSEKLTEAKLKGIGESKIESIVSQVQENYEELKWLGEYHNIIVQ